MNDPAWFVGVSVGIGWIVLGDVVAASDRGTGITRELMEGHPGADRPMEACLP